MPNSCNPIDCSPPGFSVHGILQARILEWVAISFSRGSSQPRDRTRVSCIACGFFTNVVSALKKMRGPSLVVQWLRIQLPGQGMWVLSLVRERRSHMPQGNYAHTSQLLNPHAAKILQAAIKPSMARNQSVFQ